MMGYCSGCMMFYELVNRKKVHLQYINSPPHTSNMICGQLTELEEIEVLPHPPYNPDLARSFHLNK